MPPQEVHADAAAGANDGDRAWTHHPLVGDDGQNQDYFWCGAIKLSTYVRHMDLPEGCSATEATDSQLWCALADRQIREVFKMCSACGSAIETFEDPFFVCASCLRHAHNDCSVACKETVDRGLWTSYRPYLRTCNVCAGKAVARDAFTPGALSVYQRSARGALNRIKSIPLPAKVRAKAEQIEARLPPPGAAGGEDRMTEVRHLLRDHYGAGDCAQYWRIGSSKGGEGVFATKFVPAFTRVGVMPGYPDPLCGEQTERGRPTPKYALAEINAADYYNAPFPEFRDCPAWCVNEPGVGQKSNCAWLQEVLSPSVEEGRMTVLTVRDMEEGEEALLSYGPVYPRDYPYNYDAYSFHPSATLPKGVYELWYYSSRDVEAASRGCIRHNPKTDLFERWERGSGKDGAGDGGAHKA
eukprot:Hpha_TRINITY_DN22723_c0_g1::TRINITY_DN22723_c0_g1_i1::g.34167::m.34167